MILLTRVELMEDPQDLIATHLLTATDESGARSWAAVPVILLLFGATTIVLTVALLLHCAWAHPCMIIWITTTIGSQLSRVAVTPTKGLMATYHFRRRRPDTYRAPISNTSPATYQRKNLTNTHRSDLHARLGTTQSPRAAAPLAYYGRSHSSGTARAFAAVECA